MEKRKFKVGQTICAIDSFHGFEKATVYKIDDKFYHCKIMCGTVTIPIASVESNYKIYKEK